MDKGTEPEPPDDIEDRDPGLARERTDLAWTRTAISFTALGVAITRTNPPTGIVVMLVGAGIWGLGQLSTQEIQPTARHRLTRRHTVQLITVATTLISALAITLVLLVPERGHP